MLLRILVNVLFYGFACNLLAYDYDIDGCLMTCVKELAHCEAELYRN